MLHCVVSQQYEAWLHQLQEVWVAEEHLGTGSAALCFVYVSITIRHSSWLSVYSFSLVIHMYIARAEFVLALFCPILRCPVLLSFSRLAQQMLWVVLQGEQTQAVSSKSKEADGITAVPDPPAPEEEEPPPAEAEAAAEEKLPAAAKNPDEFPQKDGVIIEMSALPGVSLLALQCLCVDVNQHFALYL